MTTQEDVKKIEKNTEDAPDELMRRLRAFIEGELLMGRATIADDEELLLSGLIDSLGAVRLINFIESDLGAHVPPEDVVIENFQTLSAMHDYIRKHATHG
jgi:acyl carrier protein